MRQPIAAAFIADTVIELIDAKARTLWRMSPKGRCERVHMFTDITELLTAAHGDDGWFLGGVDSAGVSRVYHYSDTDGASAAVVVATGRNGDPAALRRGYLTAAGRNAILSSLQWPFAWMSVDARGLKTTAAEPAGDWTHTVTSGKFSGPAIQDSIRGWVGLSTVKLDQGFLQTLADPRSDRRVFVLYDNNGHVVRATSVDVAMAAVASEPRARLLLFLRRTDRLELVVYRWHWVG